MVSLWHDLGVGTDSRHGRNGCYSRDASEAGDSIVHQRRTYQVVVGTGPAGLSRSRPEPAWVSSRPASETSLLGKPSSFAG